MKVKKVTYTKWGTVMQTLIIESKERSFVKFAKAREVVIPQGCATFERMINGHRMTYTKLK